MSCRSGSTVKAMPASPARMPKATPARPPSGWPWRGHQSDRGHPVWCRAAAGSAYARIHGRRRSTVRHAPENRAVGRGAQEALHPLPWRGSATSYDLAERGRAEALVGCAGAATVFLKPSRSCTAKEQHGQTEDRFMPGGAEQSGQAEKGKLMTKPEGTLAESLDDLSHADRVPARFDQGAQDEGEALVLPIPGLVARRRRAGWPYLAALIAGRIHASSRNHEQAGADAARSPTLRTGGEAGSHHRSRPQFPQAHLALRAPIGDPAFSARSARKGFVLRHATPDRNRAHAEIRNIGRAAGSNPVKRR